MNRENESPSFEVGGLYSIAHIQEVLRVGNAGGIRACLGADKVVRRLVVLTAGSGAKNVLENPYHDRIEDDVLTYTGAGREGDQTLAGINARIPQQFNLGFPIYGFILAASRRDPNVGPKRWRFLGLLEYLRHYPDNQVDSAGSARKVWTFEFRVIAHAEAIDVGQDYALSELLIRESRVRHQDAVDETEIASPESIEQSAVDPDKVDLLRGRLLGMDPRKFEYVVRDLLTCSGFEKVTVTKYSQDGGVDVNAFAGRSMWPVREMLVQLQAKRWLHSVGRKEVAELRGSLLPNARGAIVTTSHYSKAAITEATASHKTPIVLVDGFSLASLLIANTINV